MMDHSIPHGTDDGYFIFDITNTTSSSMLFVYGAFAWLTMASIKLCI